MDEAGETLLDLIFQLLPGFLAAWAFYGLTPYRKPSTFERVVQALIFTAIVKVLVLWARESLAWAARYVSFGTWTPDVEFGWSMASALALGVSLAYFTNRDVIHNVLWRIGVTDGSSYPSEWYKTFACQKRFVVLHLKEDRRLYGWPIDWPDHPDEGQFVLTEAEWLVDDVRIPLAVTERIIVPVAAVEMVELMLTAEEERDQFATCAAVADSCSGQHPLTQTSVS